MDKTAYRHENRTKWISAIDAVMRPAPVSATWTGIKTIVEVLQPFATSGCNHVLLPRGGGMDIQSASPSWEPGCIELNISARAAYVMRPKQLVLQHFPEDPLQSFLLLELSALPPSGVYEDTARESEEVVELGQDEYAERQHWDSGTLGTDENGEDLPLPAHARRVVRWFEGKMMVLAKGCIWNGVPATYDGRHSVKSAEQIRDEIALVMSG
jgi:hypothetical protein